MKQIHFLIEWIGGGSFDPTKGMWAITDISESATESGEGAVLSTDPVRLSGFTFSCTESLLESHEVIGGRIQENLKSVKNAGAGMLEMIQVRADSGAIEDVLHLPVNHRKGKSRPFKQVNQFQVEWQGSKGKADAGASLMKVLLEEMPGAVVLKRGKLLPSTAALTLGPGDILQVQWKGRDFFLRFVDKVNAPPSPRAVVGDPVLKKTMAMGMVLFLVFAALAYLSTSNKKEAEVPPPRIATVLVEPPPPEVKPLPPPPPPPPVAKEPPKEVKKEIPKPVKAPKVGIKEVPANKQPAKAAAPRFNTPDTPPKMGLNSPAKVTNVNSVGLLGALSKNGAKGKGVQADKIINDGIVTQSVSANDDSRIVVGNPPSGVLGTGSGGNPNATGQGLAGASTTLSGAGKYDPNSVGPVARKGGGSGLNIGSGLSDGGAGVGGGTALGGIDGGEFSVDGGGLDRETVRRVIASYRNQVRTCYEKSLLSNGALGGRIVYKWTIGADGPVITAEISNATVSSETLKACVLSVVQNMVFPPATNGKQTRVVYPFVFQSRK